MKKNLLSLVIALFSTGLFAQSIPFDDYGNVLLENYSELSDDAVIKVIITVTSDSTRHTARGLSRQWVPSFILFTSDCRHLGRTETNSAAPMEEKMTRLPSF